MNPAYPVYSWIIFAAELVGFTRLLMFLLLAVRLTHREPPPAPAGLVVDVFVATYDEPIEIVRRTVLAALAIRYPHETWLLDDGQRTEMSDLASEIGCRYLSRSEPLDAKAGNLNHALRHACGDFVAVFDADQVADPRFLDRTLGYFRDQRVAFVQTPQEFFNNDSFEHLISKRRAANGTSFFHRVVQRSRDAANATLYTGSSAVLRRRAIDEISGFATGTINEDIHTSLRFHASGWNSLFHPEILSAGIAPLDAAGYRRQHLRWAQDALQLLLRENLIAYPGLTWRQRQSYLIHVISNMEGWRHLFIYALPVVILVTGILPLQTDAPSFLVRFVPYFLVTTLAYGEFARGLGRLDQSAVYNLARCPTAIIATFTAHRERRFLVTPKSRGQDAAAESTFTYAVVLVTLAAMTYACAAAMAGRSPFAPGTLGVLVVWAAYQVLTGLRLLMLERRCARNRRATARFDEDFATTLTRIDDPQTHFAIDVVVASADGFTVRERGAALPPAGAYRGALDAPGAQFPFELAVREGGLGGAVRWPDGATRAAFDLLLHQRAIEGLAEADAGDRGGLFR